MNNNNNLKGTRHFNFKLNLTFVGRKKVQPHKKGK